MQMSLLVWNCHHIHYLLRHGGNYTIKTDLCILSRQGKFPLLPFLSSCGWTNNKMDTSKINRRKRNVNSCARKLDEEWRGQVRVEARRQMRWFLQLPRWRMIAPRISGTQGPGEKWSDSGFILEVEPTGVRERNQWYSPGFCPEQLDVWWCHFCDEHLGRSLWDIQVDVSIKQLELQIWSWRYTSTKN